MPPKYSALTDHGLCDKATAEIDFVLLTHSARDVNSDLADQRTERSQTSTARQLAEVDGKIARVDKLLEMPDLDPQILEDYTDERAALLVQRKKLVKRARQAAGLNEFMADVEDEQTAANVALLTAIKAGIAAHRATLPS
ncbi:hypothetical protein [Hymenobacter sp. B81]|uniref:hypothetical protein n=1 Tax=Hymenobacter sp. B81 TaxID=3344878 RepID=UPI0037DBFBAC